MSNEMRKELNFLKTVYIQARNSNVRWLVDLAADLQSDLLEWVRSEKPITQQVPI